MERTGASAVQDSNQNGRFGLLGNFAARQNLTSSSTLDHDSAACNIVVAASVDRPSNSQVTSEKNNCEIGNRRNSSEETFTFESSSACDLANNTGIIQSSISQNNIRKTISEIASNQESFFSPSSLSQSSLIKTGMSNLSANAAGNKYIAVQNNLDIGSIGPNKNFENQPWNSDDVACDKIVDESCNATGYIDSRQACMSESIKPAHHSSFDNPNVGSGYDPGHASASEFHSQQQQFIEQPGSNHNGNNSLEDYSQGSQLPVLEFGHHLQQDNYSVTSSQELISQYDKMENYNEASLYTTNRGVNAPLPDDAHHSLTGSYERPQTTDTCLSKSSLQQHQRVYDELQVADSLSENPDNNEKKLTTTPIPSDADKMSSSSSSSGSSSVEGSSNDGSPSPNENESDLVRTASCNTSFPASTCVNYRTYNSPLTGFSGNRTHLQASSNVDFTTNQPILYENSPSQIPLPENVIEIDQSFVDYNVVQAATNREEIPVSPLNCLTDGMLPSIAQSDNVLAAPGFSKKDKDCFDNNASQRCESSSSWSVVKEERRKRKLEKKMQQEQEKNVPGFISTSSRSKSDVSTRKHSHHKHKHKHKSKHHHKNEMNKYQLPADHDTSLQTINTSYSNSSLLPKVTADPTTNVRLNLNSAKSSAPPRSITEKVAKERLKAIAPSTKQSANLTKSNSFEITNSASANRLPNTSNQTRNLPISAKSAASTPVSAAKPVTFTAENGSSPSVPRRWQTVTAVKGPKMPPMLSEIDRIPKRGRPSKKMTELNLKSKAEARDKKVVAAAPDVVSKEPSSVVAMYTINEKGCYESLDNKGKPNQRSKDRAEAFRNELLEISKKTTIQKKTAGAKDVVGAFNAVGVRTRNQASSNLNENEKKKTKAKGKVFGGDSSAKGSEKIDVMDANAVYTFSDLAKQFKISNSILYRALEQSQKNTIGKKNSKSTSRQKEKQQKSKVSKTVSVKPPENTTSNILQSENLSLPSSGTESVKASPDLSTIRPVSHIKLTSLSSEKSADLNIDVVKRKKKTKKHKKSKGESGKKKKKDKKKKSKRKEKRASDSVFKHDSPNNVFVPVTSVEPIPLKKFSESKESKAVSSNQVVANPHSKLDQANQSPVIAKRVDESRSNSSLKKVESESSFSAGEEEVYYSEESLSEAEAPSKTAKQDKAPSTVIPTSTVQSTSTSTSSTPVFGFHVSSSMPSFQGIKEHGGLLSFSEQIKTPSETNLLRSKKHKHKKKKVTARTKNATDPEFMNKLEEIANNLKKLKLTPAISFLSSPSFGSNSSNVFARTFVKKPFSFGNLDQTDAFSYRDPSSNRTKQKRQNTLNLNNTSGSNTNSSSAYCAPNMSVFCRLAFFKNHGLVKPYTAVNDADSLNTAFGSKFPSPVTNPVESFKAGKARFSSSSFSDAPQSSCVVSKTKTSAEIDDSQSINATNQDKQTPRRPRPRGKTKASRLKQNTPNRAGSKAASDQEDTINKQNISDFYLKAITNQSSSSSSVNTPTPADSVSSGSSNPTSTENTAIAPINQDLVNHIKAAITASLSTAELGSDRVAKTVDSAVASYLKNIGSNTNIINDLSTSSDNSNPIKVPRRRGRPPKYPKLLKKLKEIDDNDNAPSDKHPKKVWASKHHGTKCVEKLKIKFRNRAPGRPRKYTSLDQNTDDSDLISPPAVKVRKVSSNAQKKTKKIDPVVNNNSKKKPTSLDTRPGVVSKKDGGNTKSFNFKNSKHKLSKSTASNDSDKHASSNLTQAPTSKRGRKSLASSSLKSRMNDNEEPNQSFESTAKGTMKKSLESVVAQLKNRNGPATSSSSAENQTPRVSTSEDEFVRNAKKTVVSESLTFTESKKRRNDGTMTSDRPEKRKRELKEPREAMDPHHEPFVVSQTDVTKTNWLNAGLFSSAFKSDSAINVNEDVETSETSLLPPPDHAGLSLRQKQKSYQLPHDIWLSYRRNSTDQLLTDTYTAIEQNIYVNVTSALEKSDVMCDCSLKTCDDESCCGSDCKNRMNFVECSEKSCQLGERCTNNLIQNKQHCLDLEKFETLDRGRGIRSTSNLQQGVFVTEFLGEVVSDVEFQQRVFENYSPHQHRFYLQFEPGKILDFFRCGNLTRFINHSCSPNCEIQRWRSCGQYHLCLFTKQFIKAGDELTFDYSPHISDLFMPPQACCCGAAKCLKTIGSSLDPGRAMKSLPVSSKKKKTSNFETGDRLLYTTVYESNMQPTSLEERNFIKLHRPFLLRNLTRIKHQHQRSNQQRSISAQKSDDKPEVNNKVDKRKLLYDTIKDIFESIVTCKDENGVSVAIPFINLRSQQRSDESKDPFDLRFVEDKIVSQQYEKFEEFSADLLHAFRNAEKKFGRKSQFGKDVARLRRVYAAGRNSALLLLGENRDKSKDKAKDSEKDDAELEDRRRNGDYIRCICGIYKDEGVMIQCEKCYVWQHCDCMKVQAVDYTDGVEYLCEECDGREVAREVKVVPQPPSAPPGHTYYLTLLKDDLLVRQGDCVRLIHDHCLRQRQTSTAPVRSSYRLQSHSTQDRMDFFRIKKLWTDDNGDKFAYGYHFVRPQDTRHVESRLFFTNELLATPFHEIVPLDAVVSLCCVMDLETYRRGKPKDFKDSDLYICQHRTDLSLRIVNKVIKNSYPVCTKSHVFETYPVRLVTVRNYQVPEQYRKSQSRRTQWLKSVEHETKSDQDDSSDDEETESICDDDVSVAFEITDAVNLPAQSDQRNFKEKRLNGILKKLLKGVTSRQPDD